MKNMEKRFAQLLTIVLLLLAGLSSPAQTCPGSLGTPIYINSLPYNVTGLTTCGKGNSIWLHTDAVLCTDVWNYYGEDQTFIFTPTVTGTYAIVLKTDRTTATMMLYNGCPFNGQGGQCVQFVTTTSNPPFKVMQLQLTAGTTYYLVFDDSNAPAGQCIPSYDLSILTQPLNDDCGGAIPLTPDAVCNPVTGTTFAASQTASVPNACGGSVDDDVWYNFTATSPNHTITLAPAAPTTNIDLVLEVHAGSCDGPNIGCSFAGNGLGVTEIVELTNLTVGTTYFVRVATAETAPEYRGYFNICVTTPAGAPPANNDCFNAVGLTLGDAPVSGTTTGATQSIQPVDCNGNADDDVWYTFTSAGLGSDFTVTASSATLDLVIDVRRAAGDCGINHACINNTGTGGTESATVTGHPFTLTYYLRVYSADATTGPFTVAVSPPPPLPVELTTLKAVAEKGAIQLTWTTASEHNNAGFQAERSENGWDFEKIAFVAGAGTSAEKHAYQLEDKAVRAGQPYFYRIKQMDSNGAFQYSDIVQAMVSGGKLALAVFPNPVSVNGMVQVRLQLPEAAEVVLTLFDAQGVVFRSERCEGTADLQTLQMPVHDLPVNTYFLRAAVNGESVYQKLIVIH